MSSTARRWIASAHLGALVIQLATAVAFVAGWTAPIVAHGTSAWIVGVTGIVQAISLGIPGVPPRVSLATLVWAVAVVVGEANQLYFGLAQGLATHVTVAMLIWAGALAIFIRVWAPPPSEAPAHGN